MNVWETKHRLFLELFQGLAEWLSDDEPRALTVLEEQMTRLLAVAITLLQQHNVNKRGQCQFCCWTRWKWRFWRSRRRCTVHQALDLAMNQSLDVVWWCVFESVGRKRNLTEVRMWLEGRAMDADSAVSGETAQDNNDDESTIVLEKLPMKKGSTCVE